MTGGVLVTGALGGLGANVVAAAVEQGVRVRALVRRPRPGVFHRDVEVLEGDAADATVLENALHGCDALVHAVNTPFSPAWVETTGALLLAALRACQRTGARMVFPGNVWVFGRPPRGSTLAENTPHAPTSRMGAARARMEAQVRSSSAPWTVVRLPEFFGPHVTTLTGPPLRELSVGGTARWFGDAGIPIQLAYMPDAGRVLLEVGLSTALLNREVNFAPTPTTARGFFHQAIRIAGGGRFQALPSWVVNVAGLVLPQARQFGDILHLWEDPVILRTDLGAVLPQRHTTLEEALHRTLVWLRENPHVRMHY